MQTCLLSNCETESTIRGLCRQHYNELVANSLVTHGIKGGILEDSPIWKSWDNAKTRCRQKGSKKYKSYGAKGITMCDGFYDSCHKFFSQLGPRPLGTSIDRINNLGGYWCGKCEHCFKNDWPMNCRWATPRQQNLNQNPRPNKTGYKGVKIKGNRFEAWINEPSETKDVRNKKYLGTFPTAQQAGEAYAKARLEMDNQC